MKHKLILLTWLAMLAFCSVVVGILALVHYGSAEVIFWTPKPVKDEAGKIAWIVISASCLILFLALAVREYRRKVTGRLPHK